jgi:hypothetical protein
MRANRPLDVFDLNGWLKAHNVPIEARVVVDVAPVYAMATRTDEDVEAARAWLRGRKTAVSGDDGDMHTLKTGSAGPNSTILGIAKVAVGGF